MKQTEENLFRRIIDYFRIDEKDLVTFFQRDPMPDAGIQRKLFIIGALLMPITFGGMLLGFIRGYRKFMFPHGMGPEFEDMPRIVKVAMGIGGVLIWFILFFSIFGIAFLAELFFGSGYEYYLMPAMIYLGVNIAGCSAIFLMFNTWRIGVRKYFYEQSKFGTARYAKEDELKPYEGKNGFFIGDKYTFHEKGHILTVAGTRSGKFVGLIAPNLLGLGGYADSWVVVDPKGEATVVTARYQMSRDNRRVVILNPWGEHADLLGDTDAYNPLDILRDRDSIHLVDDAAMIAEMILPVDKSDKDKFFSDNARSMLTGLILHLVTTHRKTGTGEEEAGSGKEGAGNKQDSKNADSNTLKVIPNDKAVRRATDNPRAVMRLKGAIRRRLSEYPEDEYIEYEEADDNELNYGVSEISLKTIWEWIRLPKAKWEKLLEDMCVNDDEVNGEIVQKSGYEIMKLMESGERTFGIIMAYLLQATDFIKSPSLQKAMKSDFDPKSLSDGNVTLYIIIPADKLVSHFRWLRLVITTAMRAVVRNKNKRVCFLLDEFATLGYMPEIETALSTYAGYNITVWPILQSLVQLHSVYEKNWESFIGNTAVRQFFGVNDNFTAKYVSQAIGMASHTKVERNFFQIKNVVANERLLVTPDEIRRGSAQFMFVFIKSLPVAVFNKQPYYLMSKLYDNDEPRFDENPYYERDILFRVLDKPQRKRIAAWLLSVETKREILIRVYDNEEALQYAEQIKDFIGVKGRKAIIKVGYVPMPHKPPPAPYPAEPFEKAPYLCKNGQPEIYVFNIYE